MLKENQYIPKKVKNKKYKEMRSKKQFGTKMMVLTVCLTLLGSFTGCSKSKDIAKDLGEDQTTVKEQSNDILKAIGLAPDEKFVVNPKTKDGNVFYEVNADVTVPENAKVNMVEEDVTLYSVKDVDAYAKNLFDDGQYEQVKPLSCYSKEELAARKEELLSALKDKEAPNYHAMKNEFIQINLLLTEGLNYQPTEYVKGDMSDCANIKFAPKLKHNNLLNVKDQQNYILKGLVDGQEYILCAYQCKNDPEDPDMHIKVSSASEGYLDIATDEYAGWLARMVDYAYVYKKNGNCDLDSEMEKQWRKDGTFCVSSEMQTDNVMKQLSESNTCQYSEEEAGKLALSFLEKCNPECSFAIQKTLYLKKSWTDTFSLRDLGEPEVVDDNTQSRYEFSIVQTVNGMQQKWGVMEPFLELQKKLENQQEVPYTELEYIVIVGDSGVESVDLGTYKIVPKENMSEEVELLSKEELASIIEEQLMISDEIAIDNMHVEAEMGGNDFENGKMKDVISMMELEMVTVNYDGKYTLCPVWNLKKKTSYGYENVILAIHAVDGSVLYRYGSSMRDAEWINIWEE